ncbi:MAG: hypothetical protein MZU79_02365 [Anaerotruncus sp.]|nr:hypothetical protein [Anaerotruncus sp.]
MEPVALRRAMVAAYEAEMNVVIHAATAAGCEAEVSPDQLEVEVEDEGPGIADIAQALQAGWSTASGAVRANSASAPAWACPTSAQQRPARASPPTPGAGTRVSFSVRAASGGGRPGRPALVARRGRRASARVPPPAWSPARRPRSACRAARPDVLHHLCIDCTACIAACAPAALSPWSRRARARCARAATLVVARRLCSPGFGEHHGRAQSLEELRGLGYDEVVSVARIRGRPATRRHRARGDRGDAPRAGLSPCPAAAWTSCGCKFPSLLDHLAPLAVSPGRPRSGPRRRRAARSPPARASAGAPAAQHARRRDSGDGRGRARRACCRASRGARTGAVRRAAVRRRGSVRRRTTCWSRPSVRTCVAVPRGGRGRPTPRHVRGLEPCGLRRRAASARRCSTGMRASPLALARRPSVARALPGGRGARERSGRPLPRPGPDPACRLRRPTWPTGDPQTARSSIARDRRACPAGTAGARRADLRSLRRGHRASERAARAAVPPRRRR